MPSDAHSTSSRRNDRMVAILAMLRDRDEVPLRDMASALGASAATIRRDVVSLAEQGLLIRSHGTARRAGTGAELPVNLRDGRRRRAVTGDVVGLLGDLLDELGADLLVGVLELDLLGDGHAVVGDRRRAPLLVEHHVATLGAEGDLDGVGELVHSPLEAAPGLLVVRDELGHCGISPVSVMSTRPSARDGRNPRPCSCPTAPGPSRGRNVQVPVRGGYVREGCHSRAPSARSS